jgi:hypothetical protein
LRPVESNPETEYATIISNGIEDIKSAREYLFRYSVAKSCLVVR